MLASLFSLIQPPFIAVNFGSRLHHTTPMTSKNNMFNQGINNILCSSLNYCSLNDIEHI